MRVIATDIRLFVLWDVVGVGSFGLQQTPRDVVGEVAESQHRSPQMLEPAIDRFVGLFAVLGRSRYAGTSSDHFLDA